MPTVIPESRIVAIKAGVEVSMITVLALPMIYLHIIIKDYQPTVRGFYCDDENIKHPYLDVSPPGQIILQMIFSSEGNCSDACVLQHLVCPKHCDNFIY